MKRIPGDVVRRVLTVSAVVLLTSVSACGNEGGGAASPGDSSKSTSPSPSAEQSASGAPGAAADGTCGGGAFKTRVVKGARGVRLTVPADWRVKSAKAGTAIGFYPPDRDAGDGFMVIENTSQTLDEAVADALKFTAEAATKTSEKDLDLPGFDGARMVTFSYDDHTFSVGVVAVFGGQRLRADMTREGVPEEQPAAESCLSSLSRTP